MRNANLGSGGDSMKALCTLVITLSLAASAIAQPFSAYLATSLLSDSTGPYTAEQYKSIKLADVNGDHVPDLCYLDVNGIKCAIGYKGPSGIVFGTPELWTSGFTLSSMSDESYWRTIQFGDINGDGYADVCGRQAIGMVCYLSDGRSGFRYGPQVASYFSDAQGWKSDPSYWQTIRLVDVNHDGSLDICGRAPQGIICTFSYLGTFGGGELLTRQFSDADSWYVSPAYWSTIQFADINGDGYPDVCGRSSQGLF